MKKALILFAVFITLQPIYAQDFKKIFSDTSFIKSDLWKKERLSYYLNVDTTNTSDFTGFFNRGIDKMQNELYEEAIPDFKLSITEDKAYTRNIPSLNKNKPEADANFYIAECQAMLERYDSAHFYYRKTIQTDPYYTEAYYRVANLYYTDDDTDKMLDIMEEGVEANPESAEMLYNQGIAYLLNSQKGKVKRIQKELIERFPEYEQSYSLLGIIYMYEQKFKMARTTFTKAIEINPDHKMAYFYRGGINILQENYTESYTDFLKFDSIDSTNFIVKKFLTFLDFKIGLYDIGLERIWQNVDTMYADSLTYMLTNPEEREFYSIMKIIHSGEILPGELSMIGDFYNKYFWDGYDDANEVLHDFAKKFPVSILAKRFSVYYLDKGIIHSNYDDDLILELLDYLIRKLPEEPNFYFLKAGVYYSRGEKEKCIDFNKMGLEKDPGFPYPYMQIGSAFRSLKEYDSAFYYQSKAIELNPDFREAYVSKATLYEKLGNHIESINNFKLAYKCPDVNTMAFVNGSIDGWDLGNLNEYNYLLNIATLYSEIGEYDSSLQYFNKLMYNYSFDRGIIEKRGAVYLNLGKYDSAILDLNHAIVLYEEELIKNPARAITYFERGNAYFYKKEYDYALEDYETARKIYPDESSFICAIADCHRNLKDYESAIKYYDKALKLSPDNYHFLLKKGVCLSDAKRLKESTYILMQVIHHDSTIAEAYGYVGWNYYQQAKYNLTIHFSKKAVSINPYAYYGYYHIGLALVRMGYYEKAYEIYKDAKFENDKLDNPDYELYIQELRNLLPDEKMGPEAAKILIEVFEVTI